MGKYDVLFNFFPRTGNMSEEEFVKNWFGICDVISKHPDFVLTQLHKNIDTNDTYQFFNYAHALTDNCFTDQYGDTRVGELINKLKEAQAAFYAGRFLEVESVSGKEIGPVTPEKTNSVFLVVAFKGTDDAPLDLAKMEKSWKEWSGVELLTSAPKSLGFVNAALYRRFVRANSPFNYVLRAEFSEMENHMDEGRELLSRMKELPKPQGISEINAALYKVIPETITGTPR